MPRLILIAAQSLDGFIARHGQPGTDFCSEADSAFLSSALKDFDSLIFGRKTFDTLRHRILNSKTKRFLRKILTRSPDAYRDLAQADQVEFTDAPPADILAELARRGRRRCALLGGGEAYTRFLEAGLVDELWLTLEPRLFGIGTPLATRALDLAFALDATSRLTPDTLLLKYLPQREER